MILLKCHPCVSCALWASKCRPVPPADWCVCPAAVPKHCFTGNIWRMYDDIQDSWDSVTGIVDWVGDNSVTNGMLEAAGPGHFNVSKE